MATIRARVTLTDFLEMNLPSDVDIAAFAKALGVEEQAVRQWMSGTARPNLKQCMQIAVYFQWDLKSILLMATAPLQAVQ